MTHRTATLESRLFRRYWDDGLLDVFAGVGTLSLARSGRPTSSRRARHTAILAVFWAPLRRRLVESRVGHVEFSDAELVATDSSSWAAWHSES